MRAERSEQPDLVPRRRARWLGWIVVTLSVLVGAAFALRRRRPALPAFVPQAPPPSAAGRHAAPVPVAPRLDPGPRTPAVVEPVAQPDAPPLAQSVAQPLAQPVAQPVAGAGREQLTRVSGLGRRSAEALVLAGIASLEALAASDAPALRAALDAAGVKRSATLATWPQQAQRLLEA